jgi:imidazolonepropionase-like amidohydrolase
MTRLLTILTFTILSLCATNTNADEITVALVGGQLMTGKDAPVVPRGAVVYRGNRIISAASLDAVVIPKEAIVIDTSGKTMMPGLIDLHIHLDLIGHGEYEDYYSWMDNMLRLPEVFPIAAQGMMRAGVTTGVDLGSTFHIKQARARIRSGEIPGPRLVISGPWITRVHMEGIPDGYQLVVASAEEARESVRWLVENGSDVIKTWEGLTLDDRIAIQDEATKAGLKVHAHVYEPQDIRDAITAGVDVLQHVGSAMNAPYADDIIKQIVADRIPVVQTISHRIWVYPITLADMGRLSTHELKADMGPEVFAEVQRSFIDISTLSYFKHIGEEMEAARLAAPQFIKAGAYMGVGTDAASPMNFHNDAMPIEMQALVESGMTTSQVLQAATRVNAEIIGKLDALGTLEPGKFADIIIVDGDPLTDIKSLRDVSITIKDGVAWFDPSIATKKLNEIGRSYGSE